MGKGAECAGARADDADPGALAKHHVWAVEPQRLLVPRGLLAPANGGLPCHPRPPPKHTHITAFSLCGTTKTSPPPPLLFGFSQGGLWLLLLLPA